MGQRGFTIIEIMIVIAILGILATSIYPLIGNTGARDVDNAARELATDLQWLQQISKNSGGGILPNITFATTAPSGYTIQRGTTIIKPSVSLPNSVTLTVTSTTFSFDAAGKCSANTTITLQGGSVSRFVIIESNGRIRISTTSP